MLTQIDVTRLPSYQLGREQGREQGQLRLLVRQIRLKFGPLAPELEARIEAADSVQIELWAERILTAHSLEEMFD